MVTNLPEAAKAKWAEVAAARTRQEKLRAMQAFLSLVPSHKGTAKLIAHVKRQMSVLKHEIEDERKRRRTGAGPKFFIVKEGAAQIVILGMTKVGRSSLLASVTNAKPLITDYPFATQEPIPGMLQFKDIQFQLIEAPALMRGAADGVGWGSQVLGLARNADGLLIVVDLSYNPYEQFKVIESELEKARIFLKQPFGEVEISKQSLGAGIQLIGGQLIGCTVEDIKQLLKSYRIHNAIVKLRGQVTLDNIEDAVFVSTVYKPAIIVANKIDVPKSETKLQELRLAVSDRAMILSVSCKTGLGLESLGESLFKMLKIERIYAKEPDKVTPSPKPVVVRKGTTLIEFAKYVHSYLYNNLKYARIWGSSAKYPGERVGADHVLEDGDIVEIHTR